MDIIVKAEQLAREKEEGKPEKKKRKVGPKRKNVIGPSSSAGEAIEKMLQEKKISSKINYEILMSLNNATEKPDTSIDKKTILEPSVVIDETPSRKYVNLFILLKKFI